MTLLTLLACLPNDSSEFDLVLVWDPVADILTLDAYADAYHHLSSPADVNRRDCFRFGNSDPEIAGSRLRKLEGGWNSFSEECFFQWELTDAVSRGLDLSDVVLGATGWRWEIGPLWASHSIAWDDPVDGVLTVGEDASIRTEGLPAPSVLLIEVAYDDGSRQEFVGPEGLVQNGALTSFAVPYSVWPPGRLDSMVVGARIMGDPVHCPGRDCLVFQEREFTLDLAIGSE
jgi:hypothetical protein